MLAVCWSPEALLPVFMPEPEAPIPREPRLPVFPELPALPELAVAPAAPERTPPAIPAVGWVVGLPGVTVLAELLPAAA